MITKDILCKKDKITWIIKIAWFQYFCFEKELDLHKSKVYLNQHKPSSLKIHVIFKWSRMLQNSKGSKISLKVHFPAFFMLCAPEWYRLFIKFCVFSNILRYIPDSGLSGFPLGVSEWMTGQTPALQRQNLQSSEKSQNFKE